MELEGHCKDLNALTVEAYAELRRLAAHHLKNERPSHTLRPTDLVHETYLRLIKQHSIGDTDRLHFLSLASTLMRRVLVDHARSRKRLKRGDGHENIPLDAVTAETRFDGEDVIVDILALETSLEALAATDETQVRIVEMHFYGGLNFEEIAEVLGVSLSTVMREWRFARAWLYNQLSEADP